MNTRKLMVLMTLLFPTSASTATIKVATFSIHFGGETINCQNRAL